MALTEITYVDKETLNEQPSIADKNKVTDDDMNEIKSVVNTNAGKVGDLANLSTTTKASVVDAINETITKEAYSTTEIKTNKVWSNGKPIYRRIFSPISLNANVEANVLTFSDYSIAEITKLSDSYFLMQNGEKWFAPTTLYDSTIYMTLWTDAGHVKARTKTLSSTLTLILEYTKTTD